MPLACRGGRIDAPALDEEFAFLPLDASLAQHLGNGGKFVRVKFASILQAYGNATHAGDTRLAIHLPGIILVDSPNGARRSAGTAGDAVLRYLGHHAVASSLLIRTIARNRGLGRIPIQQLLPDPLRKLCKLRHILRIRSPSGKLSSNGVLCNGSNRRNHPKSGTLRNVFQLYERILKRAVSVNTNQNSPSSVATHHSQSLNRHSWNSAGIRRGGDYGHVVLRHRDPVEIQSAIGQVDGSDIPAQRPGHKARHFVRSTRRTKHYFEHVHRGTLPYAW